MLDKKFIILTLNRLHKDLDYIIYNTAWILIVLQ